jgi:hypothetical protein
MMMIASIDPACVPGLPGARWLAYAGLNKMTFAVPERPLGPAITARKNASPGGAALLEPPLPPEGSPHGNGPSYPLHALTVRDATTARAVRDRPRTTMRGCHVGASV